jgi:ferritin-like metal-binding protein YciE
MKTLYDLFEATLKDVYYAEATILKALPKMIKAVKSEQLKSAFTHHLEETKAQVGRLDRVFKIIDVKPEGKKCPVIEGLVKECEDVIAEAEDDDVRDAGVLACAQAVEHYEISRYGTLRTWADCLELKDAVGLLQETLIEEKHADEGLSELAYGVINGDAEDDSDEKPSANSTRSKDAKTPTKQRSAAGAAK